MIKFYFNVFSLMYINPFAKRYAFAKVYNKGLNAFNLDFGQGLFNLKPLYYFYIFT